MQNPRMDEVVARRTLSYDCARGLIKAGKEMRQSYSSFTANTFTKMSQAGCLLRAGRSRFIIACKEKASSRAESCLCLHGLTAGESKAEARGEEEVRKVEKCPCAAEPRTGSPRNDWVARAWISSVRKVAPGIQEQHFLGTTGSRKKNKGVNPHLPNFGEFGTGATNDRIIHICENMCGKMGKVGFVANFSLKRGNGRVKEEAEEGRG